VHQQEEARLALEGANSDEDVSTYVSDAEDLSASGTDADEDSETGDNGRADARNFKKEERRRVVREDNNRRFRELRRAERKAALEAKLLENPDYEPSSATHSSDVSLTESEESEEVDWAQMDTHAVEEKVDMALDEEVKVLRQEMAAKRKHRTLKLEEQEQLAKEIHQKEMELRKEKEEARIKEVRERNAGEVARKKADALERARKMNERKQSFLEKAKQEEEEAAARLREREEEHARVEAERKQWLEDVEVQ
jgi:hypothetical protein